MDATFRNRWVLPDGFRSSSSRGILRYARHGRSDVKGGRTMPLEVTPVYRNLRTRATFFGLEAEDLFAILAAAVFLNIFGRFLYRDIFGVPMDLAFNY